MRSVFLIVSAAALVAGCIPKKDPMPSTSEPLFTAADMATERVLKDGVWAARTEPGCPVILKGKPVSEWPACAQAVVVRGGQMSLPGAQTMRDYVLTSDGRGHGVLQRNLAPEGSPPSYSYISFVVSEVDADGRGEQALWSPLKCLGADASGAVPPCDNPTRDQVLRASASSRDINDDRIWTWEGEALP